MTLIAFMFCLVYAVNYYFKNVHHKIPFLLFGDGVPENAIFFYGVTYYTAFLVVVYALAVRGPKRPYNAYYLKVLVLTIAVILCSIIVLPISITFSFLEANGRMVFRWVLELVLSFLGPSGLPFVAFLLITVLTIIYFIVQSQSVKGFLISALAPAIMAAWLLGFLSTIYSFTINASFVNDKIIASSIELDRAIEESDDFFAHQAQTNETYKSLRLNVYSSWSKKALNWSIFVLLQITFMLTMTYWFFSAALINNKRWKLRKFRISDMATHATVLFIILLSVILTINFRQLEFPASLRTSHILIYTFSVPYYLVCLLIQQKKYNSVFTFPSYLRKIRYLEYWLLRPDLRFVAPVGSALKDLRATETGPLFTSLQFFVIGGSYLLISGLLYLFSFISVADNLQLQSGLTQTRVGVVLSSIGLTMLCWALYSKYISKRLRRRWPHLPRIFYYMILVLGCLILLSVMFLICMRFLAKHPLIANELVILLLFLGAGCVIFSLNRLPLGQRVSIRNNSFLGKATRPFKRTGEFFSDVVEKMKLRSLRMQGPKAFEVFFCPICKKNYEARDFTIKYSLGVAFCDNCGTDMTPELTERIMKTKRHAD